MTRLLKTSDLTFTAPPVTSLLSQQRPITLTKRLITIQNAVLSIWTIVRLQYVPNSQRCALSQSDRRHHGGNLNFQIWWTRREFSRIFNIDWNRHVHWHRCICIITQAVALLSGGFLRPRNSIFYKRKLKIRAVFCVFGNVICILALQSFFGSLNLI